MIEQKLLLDNIPDGAIIYSVEESEVTENVEQEKVNSHDESISSNRKLDRETKIKNSKFKMDIKYTNNTFKKMFEKAI